MQIPVGVNRHVVLVSAVVDTRGLEFTIVIRILAHLISVEIHQLV